MAQEHKLATQESDVDRGQIEAPQAPVLPPSSSRTLHHPSFQSLYMAVGSMQYTREALRHREAGFAGGLSDAIRYVKNRESIDLPLYTLLWRKASAKLPAMIPSDFFYVDPTQVPGQRVSNSVSQLEVFECCQLNTPRPIMSTSIAPSLHLDSFGREPHLIRDLGSQVTSLDPPCTPAPSASPLATRRRMEIIQLSVEEDEAITSLLKLHYSTQDSTADDHLMAMEDGVQHSGSDTISPEHGTKGNHPGTEERVDPPMCKELTAMTPQCVNCDVHPKPFLEALNFAQADGLLYREAGNWGEGEHEDMLPRGDLYPERWNQDVEQCQLRASVHLGTEQGGH